MLRRKAAAKPEQKQWHFDPSKAYTLEDIGLRYNAEKDKITLLDQPKEEYRYKMKAGDEEYNDQLWLAMCRILREMTSERLAQNDLTRLRVPLGAAETERHTELYVSEGYEKKKELTVVLPDGDEMGSWFGRLTTDHTIEAGSFEALVKLFTKPSRGIIIASPTICVWSKALERAVTNRQHIIITDKITSSAKIPGSETQQAHVEYVLDKFAKATAAEQINVVAVGYSAWAALSHFHKDWSNWQARLTAVACLATNHSVDEFSDSDFLDFLSANCINFNPSAEPLRTVVDDRRFGCMNVSGGSSIGYELPLHCLPACLEFIEAIQEGGTVEYTQMKEEDLVEHSLGQEEWQDLVEERIGNEAV